MCDKIEIILSFERSILAKYRIGNQTTTSISFTIASMAELQKKTVPGFLWIHSSSSSVPSTSSYRLYFSLPLSLPLTYIHIRMHTYTRTYPLFFHLFLAPPFLPLLNSIAFRISHEAAIIMATNLLSG